MKAISELKQDVINGVFDPGGGHELRHAHGACIAAQGRGRVHAAALRQ